MLTVLYDHDQLVVTVVPTSDICRVGGNNSDGSHNGAWSLRATSVAVVV